MSKYLDLLILISGGFAFLALVLFVVFKFYSRRRENTEDEYLEQFTRELIVGNKRGWRRKLNEFLVSSFAIAMKVPLLRTYTQNIRRKLRSIHAYDERTMRKETMKITFSTLLITIAAGVILLLINRTVISIFQVLIMGYVVNALIIDAFISRIEFRLLKQIPELTGDVRHHFHRHGMVDQAVLEGAESSSYETGLHGKKIYEILTSNYPEQELDQYYEEAPNRFLKWFAGFSFLIKQFGDRVLTTGSMYLSALTRMNNDIRLEILKREKLNYLFRSLTAIAIIPMFFIVPIKRWAGRSFPILNSFYEGQPGIIVTIVIFAVTLLSYVLVRKLQENNEGNYRAKKKKYKWESKLLEIKPIRSLMIRFIPGPHKREYQTIQRLLKETNSNLTVEWFYLRRIIFSVIAFVLVMSLLFYLQESKKHNILYAPTASKTSMFGEMSAKELEKANADTAFDRQIITDIQRLEIERDDLLLTIQRAVQQANTLDLNPIEVNTISARIYEKIIELDNTYLKWWQLAAAILIGYSLYWIPVWILMFQRKLRMMDMQLEVDEYLSLIVILREFEHMSVESILVWMERYAQIFKEPLQQCLMNYRSGAFQALEQLKEDAPFIPFVRIVEKLQLAVEKISIKRAFDDLESDINYYYEKRKQDYEQMITTKSSWGQMIGFTPMYVLVFLYLVFPLVYSSFIQMQGYFDQISTL